MGDEKDPLDLDIKKYLSKKKFNHYYPLKEGEKIVYTETIGRVTYAATSDKIELVEIRPGLYTSKGVPRPVGRFSQLDLYESSLEWLSRLSERINDN